MTAAHVGRRMPTRYSTSDEESGPPQVAVVMMSATHSAMLRASAFSVHADPMIVRPAPNLLSLCALTCSNPSANRARHVRGIFFPLGHITRSSSGTKVSLDRPRALLHVASISARHRLLRIAPVQMAARGGCSESKRCAGHSSRGLTTHSMIRRKSSTGISEMGSIRATKKSQQLGCELNSHCAHTIVRQGSRLDLTA